MESLINILTRLIAEHLAKPRSVRGGRGTRGKSKKAIDREAEVIAEVLIAQAVAHGFPAKVYRVTPESLAEGSTAQVVARIHVPLSFIFKLDNSSKLVEEARLMRRFRDDDGLPASFRERFPRVFALKDDDKPFAYLMEDFSTEDGYESLARKLFHTLPSEARAAASVYLIGEALEALFEAYEASATSRLLPNIKADYLDRIRDRLTEAAALDKVFQSVPLKINGVEFLPWEEQLSQIAAQEEKLSKVSPPFVCAVHGDPNPENIMLKDDEHGVIVKFIDPKAWERGDYLFDMTKIAHYLWATGPVEQASGGQIELDDEGSIRYSIERPAWVQPVIELIRERAFLFGRAHNDASGVDLRWELGMASNLLGLPPGRWKNRKRNEARIFYAEGITWLDRFRSNFLKPQ